MAALRAERGVCVLTEQREMLAVKLSVAVNAQCRLQFAHE